MEKIDFKLGENQDEMEYYEHQKKLNEAMVYLVSKNIFGIRNQDISPKFINYFFKYFLDLAVMEYGEFFADYSVNDTFLEFTKMEYALIYYLNLLSQSSASIPDYKSIRQELIIYFAGILMRPGSWSQSNNTLYLAMKKFTFGSAQFSLPDIIKKYRRETFKPFQKTYFQFIQSELLLNIAETRRSFSSLINEMKIGDIFLQFDQYSNATMNLFALNYEPILLLYASLGLSIFENEAQAILAIDAYYGSYASKHSEKKVGLSMLLNLKNLLKDKNAIYFKSILDSRRSTWNSQDVFEAIAINENITFDFSYLLKDVEKFPFSKQNFKLEPSPAGDNGILKKDELGKMEVLDAARFICNRSMEAQN